jgi:hypothetical protein
MKRTKKTPVDSSQAPRYYRIGTTLLSSARDLSELAGEEEGYGNAIAILAIHAAIALSDALAIGYSGYKSGAGEHVKAAEVLQEALGSRADARQIKSLRDILKKKDAASYLGVFFTLAEARALLEKLTSFTQWAEVLYRQRPPSAHT